jgi:hypothetical protein
MLPYEVEGIVHAEADRDRRQGQRAIVSACRIAAVKPEPIALPAAQKIADRVKALSGRRHGHLGDDSLRFSRCNASLKYPALKVSNILHRFRNAGRAEGAASSASASKTSREKV